MIFGGGVFGMEIRTEEFTDMWSENRINSPLNEG